MAAGWRLFAGMVFCLTRTAILENLLKEDEARTTGKTAKVKVTEKKKMPICKSREQGE